MRTVLRTCIVLISAIVFASADSCSSVEEKREASQRQILLENNASALSDMSTNLLSDSAQNAFEYKAVQKLHDIGSYLTIGFNTKLDPNLRQASFDMLRRTYATDPFTISNGRLDSIPIFDHRMNSLVKDHTFDRLQVTFDSVIIAGALTRRNDVLWTGKLAFKASLEGLKGDRIEVREVQHGTEDYSLAKVIKVMGNDTANVWQLYLGKVD